MACRKWRKSLTILRILLSLLIVGQGIPVYGAGFVSSPITVRVRANHGVPSAVADLNAQTDMATLPPQAGRVMLEWSAPQSGDGSSVFSYVVKYATFPVTPDLMENTTAWWNHPNTLTVQNASSNPAWGVFESQLPGSAESLQVTGLEPGQMYYFGIRAYDRYHQLADADVNLVSVAGQASARASTVPYKAMPINPLTCTADTLENQAVKLDWTIPDFLRYNEGTSDYTDVIPATIAQGARYCVQYSTVPPTGTITSLENNWVQNSIYVSTGAITSGDSRSLVVRGLSEDTTYYFLVFTRTDWVWSLPNAAAGCARPNQHIGSVENIAAVSGGSIDPNIGSSIKLSWDNPDQALLSGVKICYSTTSYPSNSDHQPSVVLADQLVGVTTGYTFGQLLPRTTYYFNVYSYDTNGVYSEAVQVSTCTNVDLLPPDPVTGVTGSIGPDQEGDLSISVSWTIPAALPSYRNGDYIGTEIEFGEVGVAGSEKTTFAGQNGQSQEFIHRDLKINTSYYYIVRGYDPDNNFAAAVATTVFISASYGKPGAPAIVSAEPVAEDDPAFGCGVGLKWNVQEGYNLNSIRIVYSSEDYPSDINDGTLIDQRVITAGTDYETILNQLEPDTTYYFALAAVSDFGITSDLTFQKVITAVPWNDGVAPFLPLGIKTEVLSSTGVKVTWKPVRYNNNKKAFADKSNPTISELYSYNVYRSTDLYASDWELCYSTRGAACEYDNTIAANKKYYYKIRARDVSNNYRDSLIADMDGGLIILNTDRSYVWLPREAVTDLNYMDIQSNTAEEQGPVVRSIEWHAYNVLESSDAFDMSTVTNFNAQRNISAAPDAQSQPVRSGELVMSARARQTAPSAIQKAPGQDLARLSIFYFNGSEWMKLNSTADETGQCVKTPIKFTGKYQLRASSPATEFAFLGIMPRIITPNNDGMNDRVLFRYANPKNSAVSINIFDVRGALVKKLEQTTRTSDIQGEFVYWDGTDNNGATVLPGVYIYQIQGEGKLINGTIVVAR